MRTLHLPACAVNQPGVMRPTINEQRGDLGHSFYGLFSIGFEVSYIMDYKVWSSEITGEPLPDQTTISTTTQQPASGQAIVTWTTQSDGPQVRIALQIVLPTAGAGGGHQAVGALDGGLIAYQV